MKTVFTGWRTVTPGTCGDCGCDEDWDCDGRGTIYCSCQTCPDCSMFDGHDIGCASTDGEDATAGCVLVSEPSDGTETGSAVR